MSLAAGSALAVTLDVSEVPELSDWGQQAKELAAQWYPRINHLIPTKGFEPAQNIQIRIQKSNRGIADTSGNRIRISSGWVEKHPEDIGLVFHELVHVIQGYPDGQQSWLTEGIADYLRWAIYEAKPQEWFSVPDQSDGYRQGYRVCAGFLLWLESDRAPGVVKKLNTALRRDQYSDLLFEEYTDQTLENLWQDYVQERRRPSGTDEPRQVRN